MGKYKKKRGKLKGIVRAFLAQSVERAAFNRKVVGSRPTGGVFYIRINKRQIELTRHGKKEHYNRRAHSSVVEHRTAVPVVIGSNPIVPFFSTKIEKSK